ncbi:unnamed protein product [Prorocentrum cordatum]|uniref:Endonuclease/exonuclease/phosphatase domain-containing protein n=1 Tax=Prorocentrum cordatum TaxID=2364126 RepID=A0ABN9SC46_9DINO|nr:unnamed protein product [Polarella glacialis]
MVGSVPPPVGRTGSFQREVSSDGLTGSDSREETSDHGSSLGQHASTATVNLVLRAPRRIHFEAPSETDSPACRGRPVEPRRQGTPSKSRKGRSWGATIIPIRTNAEGKMEVLCAQSTMVNYLMTQKSSEPVLMNCPCDVRILGGLYAPGQRTPLDTMIAGLTAAGVRGSQRYVRSHVAERVLLERAALHLRLFSMTPHDETTRAAAKVFHFVCTMDATVGNTFAETLNRMVKVQLDFCEAMGDELFSMKQASRAPMCPKFVEVRWFGAEELLEHLSRPFFNDYMRDQFQKHGVGNQERESSIRRNPHRRVLTELCSLTFEEALKRARLFEGSLRQLSNDEMAATDYSELQDSANGLLSSVRSFNLNVLPWGASAFGSGQGRHALPRLLHFLQAIGERRAGSLAPDVLALQELFATPFVPPSCLQRYAVREMANLADFAATGPKPSLFDLFRDRKWTDSGLVVFSRFPIIKQKFIKFTSSSGLDSGATKGALWVQLEISSSGKCIDVINCHLQASHTGDKSDTFQKIRRSQLSQLRELVQEAGHERVRPLLLTGDFNVDAIPEPSDPTGSYGLALPRERKDSKDYEQMLQVLDPDGDLVDLLNGPTRESPLKKGWGQHPCTRPPRLKLPMSMQYRARHKYPQRLDYVFYWPSLSSLVEHRETWIDEFKASPSQAILEQISKEEQTALA